MKRAGGVGLCAGGRGGCAGSGGRGDPRQCGSLTVRVEKGRARVARGGPGAAGHPRARRGVDGIHDAARPGARGLSRTGGGSRRAGPCSRAGAFNGRLLTQALSGLRTQSVGFPSEPLIRLPNGAPAFAHAARIAASRRSIWYWSRRLQESAAGARRGELAFRPGRRGSAPSPAGASAVADLAVRFAASETPPRRDELPGVAPEASCGRGRSSGG